MSRIEKKPLEGYYSWSTGVVYINFLQLKGLYKWAILQGKQMGVVMRHIKNNDYSYKEQIKQLL